MSSIAIRLALLAGLALGVYLVWMAGRAVASLRGPRPDNVIWYPGDQMAVGLAFIPFGLAAIWARHAGVEGWEDAPALWLAGVCFALAAMMALIVFRYRLTLTDEALIERRIILPGVRRVPGQSPLAVEGGTEISSSVVIPAARAADSKAA